MKSLQSRAYVFRTDVLCPVLTQQMKWLCFWSYVQSAVWHIGLRTDALPVSLLFVCLLSTSMSALSAQNKPVTLRRSAAVKSAAHTLMQINIKHDRQFKHL